MKRSSSWKGALVEVAVIIFSVLLALGIDEWREARKQQQTVAAALQGIANELRGNERMLAQRVAYYAAIADTIGSLRDRLGDAATPESIPGWRGLMPPLLRDASYQAAIATEAFSNMEFAMADRLAQVYTFQELYGVLMDKAMDRIITPPDETLAQLRGMFRELAHVGGELDGVYEQMLQHLPAAPAEAPDP